MTTLEAGLHGIQPTNAGLSLISRKCSTTTLCWGESISRRSKLPGMIPTARWSRKYSITCFVK